MSIKGFVVGGQTVKYDYNSLDNLPPGGGGGGTTDYSDLENKPSINGVTLSGNKTGADLLLNKTPVVYTMNGEENIGVYLNDDGKVRTSTNTNFRVSKYAVASGKTYRIHSNSFKLAAALPAVVFSSTGDLSNNALYDSVIITATTTETSYDTTYTPQTDGYLLVARFYSNDLTLTVDYTNSVTDAEIISNILAVEYFKGVVSASDTVVNRYIDSNGKLLSAGADSYTVSWYPVKANVKYTISGSARLGGTQGLVCFDDVFNSTVFHTLKTLIQTGTNVVTNYNINYTPTEDGYIVMPSISTVNLAVASWANDSDRIRSIEKSVWPKFPIKIQLFGDSITDNKWGDEVTWANYITQNLDGYDVTVLNEAVGGCGIGHGKSTTTESHQTEEYNYVYDLVTNGTTLATDANYIVILVGTNNWASGTDLGDMSSTGYSTVYGSLKGILSYISEHSAATVFVCTIPQRYNTADAERSTNTYGEPINDDNVSLADYCEPFRKVSAFYGMPCIHLNEALGWNRLNISNFTSDGLHPNAKGDKMLAAFICAEIQKHIGKVSYT